MSWMKRISDLLRHPPVPEGAAPVAAPVSVPGAEEPPVTVAPAVAASPVTSAPVVPAALRPAKPSNRPVAPLLAAQAAAAKAAAEAVRREQAAASARQILASIGVSVPQAPRAAAPAPAPAPARVPMALLSPQRKALITEAMRHWAHGHQIYERLDPGLKDRVRAIAERMAPK